MQQSLPSFVLDATADLAPIDVDALPHLVRGTSLQVLMPTHVVVPEPENAQGFVQSIPIGDDQAIGLGFQGTRKSVRCDRFAMGSASQSAGAGCLASTAQSERSGCGRSPRCRYGWPLASRTLANLVSYGDARLRRGAGGRLRVESREPWVTLEPVSGFKQSH